MAKTKSKVLNVGLSKEEIVYMIGMLEAYQEKLSFVEEKRKNSKDISRELKMAKRLEEKLTFV